MWRPPRRPAAALLVLAGICALVSEGLRRQATVHGRAYAAGAVMLALVAVSLVTQDGLIEPRRAMLTYALAGAGILVLNRRWRQPGVDLLGWVLLAAAGPWALWHIYGGLHTVWPAALIAEAFLLAAWPLVLGLRQPRRTRTWSPALAVATLVAAGGILATAIDYQATGLCRERPALGGPLTWAGLALFFNLVAAARGGYAGWPGWPPSWFPIAVTSIGRRLAWPGDTAMSLALSVALLAIGVLCSASYSAAVPR